MNFDIVINALAIPREVEVPNVEIVAVRPDWTDHRGLLGAYNQLTSQYLTTPFLALLLRAADETKRALAEQPPRKPAPFFLVLDEMNLARVEHYFADFLSALESGEPLHLHDSVELEEGSGDPDAADLPIPRRLPVPPNLFFIGTVNVDESTYLFSPKVLDRAFTLELNAVDLHGLGGGIVRGGDLELGKWNGRLDPPEKPGSADWKSPCTSWANRAARSSRSYTPGPTRNKPKPAGAAAGPPAPRRHHCLHGRIDGRVRRADRAGILGPASHCVSPDRGGRDRAVGRPGHRGVADDAIRGHAQRGR